MSALCQKRTRRRIAFPKAGTTTNGTRLQQGFAINEMGFRVSSHGSNLGPLMSALCQKQTSVRVHANFRFALSVAAGYGTSKPLAFITAWAAVDEIKWIKADMDQHGCDVRFVPIRTRALQQLRANRVLVDIFLLDIMNSHKGFNSFDDPLGVSDQIMINIRRSEAMGEPMQ
jgi:hypothetical protein